MDGAKSQSPALVEVKKLSPTEMLFRWEDGAEKACSAARLRRNCRCAYCMDELSGARLLDPSGVPDDLIVGKITLVGRYALGFEFDDGHASGIYPFPLIRKILDL